MRTKTQLLKTASTLKTFSGKIKSAQDEVLTPEAVKDMAMEIMEVAEVAAEMAEEIAENVPAENGMDMDREERMEPEQIEMAQEEEDKDEDKQTAGTARGAADTDEDEEKRKLREQVASLSKDLSGLKREAKLSKLAPKYASLFPKSMHEAKMNEILNSNQPLNIIEAKIQEASDIITNKTMVKVASMTDSPFGFTDESDSEEVNIAAKM